MTDLYATAEAAARAARGSFIAYRRLVRPTDGLSPEIQHRTDHRYRGTSGD
jgi:hypothetical protein